MRIEKLIRDHTWDLTYYASAAFLSPLFSGGYLRPFLRTSYSYTQNSKLK